MAKLYPPAVTPSWSAEWYVLPLESARVNTCEVEPPPRTQTAIQFPAVFGLTNESDEVVVEPASLLGCLTSVMLSSARTSDPNSKKSERAKHRLTTTYSTENLRLRKLIAMKAFAVIST